MSGGRKIQYPILADPDRRIAQQWGAPAEAACCWALACSGRLATAGSSSSRYERSQHNLDTRDSSVLQACWIQTRRTRLGRPLQLAACSSLGPTAP